MIWDQHACLPLDPTTDFDEVVRTYAPLGPSLVSINVGYGSDTSSDVMPVLEAFRTHVLASPDSYVLARAIEDVDAAIASGRVAIIFDLEDTNPLDGRVEMVERYYELGVRTMLMTYNGQNLAGHGCHDDPEGGLTDFGRAVIAEMNRVGMVVDVAHCSIRTSFDAMEASEAPVIVSHTACRALNDHERNVTDDQIRACAETGGVIGITGVGIFLGQNDTRTATLADHVVHAVEVAGVDHVGLGSDYVFDDADLNAELEANPHLFPESYSRWGRIDFVRPSQLLDLREELTGRGFADAEVEKVLGENFRRVAAAVWR